MLKVFTIERSGFSTDSLMTAFVTCSDDGA
jgi:hypothetical protein